MGRKSFLLNNIAFQYDMGTNKIDYKTKSVSKTIIPLIIVKI
jgi:hypothetical protein